MADLRILLLVSLLSLPPGQGEGPCLDELYVEGCPSYLFQAIGLYLDTNRTVFIEPREISEIIIRSGGYQPVNITTRRQIRLWKNGSEVCVDGPGLQTIKRKFSNNYLEIQSSKPLWFSLDCINASHSCRFHRLVKVVFVPDENGLVTWRPEAHLFELKVGVLGRTGRIAPVQPANGQHSYNITIHGSSAGSSSASRTLVWHQLPFPEPELHERCILRTSHGHHQRKQDQRSYMELLRLLCPGL
ncbi:uncharacterized protein [Penaeus vannamei]|uniref:uncharacterized protein isoform X6 n=1 Tax=Penaeus vannamei TaxID=6689 RepID=UPI00387F5730